MPLKDPIKRKAYFKEYCAKWYQRNRECVLQRAHDRRCTPEGRELRRLYQASYRAKIKAARNTMPFASGSVMMAPPINVPYEKPVAIYELPCFACGTPIQYKTEGIAKRSQMRNNLCAACKANKYMKYPMPTESDLCWYKNINIEIRAGLKPLKYLPKQDVDKWWNILQYRASLLSSSA